MITGVIDSYVYYPIVKKLLEYPLETAKNTNLSSWVWWSFSSIIYIVYYSIQINDIPTILIAINHFIGCTIVAYLTYKYKKKYNIKLF